jgi:hypothetical protein
VRGIEEAGIVWKRCKALFKARGVAVPDLPFAFLCIHGYPARVDSRGSDPQTTEAAGTPFNADLALWLTRHRANYK